MGQVYGKYFVINFLDLEISFFLYLSVKNYLKLICNGKHISQMTVMEAM